MSLEEHLSTLTAALHRNSDLLEGLTAKAKAGAGSAATTEAKKGDADEKPARGGRKPAATKEKAPTVAEMKDLATSYLDVTDEDEYNDRRALLRAVVDHFGAEKFTTIDSKDRLIAFKLIQTAADGENVDPDDIAGAIKDLGGSSEEDSKSSRRRSDDI